MKVRLRFPALLISLVATGLSSRTEPSPDEKFMVLRAAPATIEQLEVVRELHDNMHKYDLDFWLAPVALGQKADIMVREERRNWLETFLANHSIPHNVTIQDVQQLILEREHRPTRAPTTFSKRLNDEGGNKARYGLGEYHSYDHITSWMDDIQRNYPNRAKVVNIGTTEEGRPIKGIKIGTGVQRTDKRVVWIDGGIHAREWAAVHTVVYIIDRLIADYDTDPLVQRAVDQLSFYIFPVLNPDGYEFSRSGVSPTIRLWRKNRSSMICKKDRWFRERCCGGVDLNRNFDWFWGEIGSSSDRCSEIYQGKGPFSEAEARAVRDTILSPELRGKVDAFLTLHTYSQMWIHPFSHQRKTVPEDISDIEQVGRKALGALESVYGTKYRFGTGADILYPSSGGSDDWAKGKGGAKYVYLMELRPSEDVWDGFILDSHQLIPTGRETWAGIKVVIEAVLKLKRDASPATALESSTNTITSTSSTTTTTATSPTTTWTTTMQPLNAASESGAVSWGIDILPAPLLHSTVFVRPLPSTTAVPPFALTNAPGRFSNFVRVPATPPPLNSKREWILTDAMLFPSARSSARTSTPPTATTNPATITSPAITTSFFRRRRPVRPVFVASEARSLALARLRQHQAELDSMRQRIRSNPNIRQDGEARTSGRQVVLATFDRSTISDQIGNAANARTCADKSPWCAAWLQRNRRVCVISSIFMRRDCARTCRFCSS